MIINMVTKGNTKNTSVKQSKATNSKTQKSSSKTQKKEKVVEEPVVEEPVVQTKKKTGGSRQKKEKVVEPVVEELVVEQDEQAIKAGLRYFKLDFEGEVGGRYSGKKPKQAANKAYSSIVKKKGMEGGSPRIQFSIKECTRGSRQKTYTYDGERIELEEPVIVNIKKGDKKTITYKFSNKLSKAKNIVE